MGWSPSAAAWRRWRAEFDTKLYSTGVSKCLTHSGTSFTTRYYPLHRYDWTITDVPNPVAVLETT